MSDQKLEAVEVQETIVLSNDEKAKLETYTQCFEIEPKKLKGYIALCPQRAIHCTTSKLGLKIEEMDDAHIMLISFFIDKSDFIRFNTVDILDFDFEAVKLTTLCNLAIKDKVKTLNVRISPNFIAVNESYIPNEKFTYEEINMDSLKSMIPEMNATWDINLVEMNKQLDILTKIGFDCVQIQPMGSKLVLSGIHKDESIIYKNSIDPLNITMGNNEANIYATSFLQYIANIEDLFIKAKNDKRKTVMAHFAMKSESPLYCEFHFPGSESKIIYFLAPRVEEDNDDNDSEDSMENEFNRLKRRAEELTAEINQKNGTLKSYHEEMKKPKFLAFTDKKKKERIDFLTEGIKSKFIALNKTKDELNIAFSNKENRTLELKTREADYMKVLESKEVEIVLKASEYLVNCKNSIKRYNIDIEVYTKCNGNLQSEITAMQEELKTLQT